MKENLARALIGAVLLINLQAALAFVVWPYRYAPAFELTGTVGQAVVRGFGVLFLMWNVPYCVAAWQPRRYKLALIMALVMQTIGVVGEYLIYAALPNEHSLIRSALSRFIRFDAFGLLALLAAFMIIRQQKHAS